jgi:hypothetical protein
MCLINLTVLYHASVFAVLEQAACGCCGLHPGALRRQLQS